MNFHKSKRHFNFKRYKRMKFYDVNTIEWIPFFRSPKFSIPIPLFQPALKKSNSIVAKDLMLKLYEIKAPAHGLKSLWSCYSLLFKKMSILPKNVRLPVFR